MADGVVAVVKQALPIPMSQVYPDGAPVSVNFRVYVGFEMNVTAVETVDPVTVTDPLFGESL